MARNFDFVAPFYPLLERAAFGDELNVARLASLDSVLAAERVLLIGEGNGRFLADCLKKKIGGTITVVDSSEKMLRLLQTRIRDIETQSRLELVHADFCAWPSSTFRFDLIVTHFFLDLFRPNSQRRIIEKITTLSGSETIWVNLDFQPVIKSTLHRWIDWCQYRFDQTMSGIEADRHYDSGPIVEEFRWNVREKRLFCNGTVLCQVLKSPVERQHWQMPNPTGTANAK